MPDIQSEIDREEIIGSEVMLNHCAWIKIILLLTFVTPKVFSQLETTIPAPTKKTPVEAKPTCDTDPEILFPMDTSCYLNKQVILMKNDSLRGKEVRVLKFVDSLIVEKYDEYHKVFMVSKDIKSDFIYYTLVALRYGSSFSVPAGVCVRVESIEYYKKMFQGKSFYALETGYFGQAFYTDGASIKDPFTGELFNMSRTDLLEFSKLTILDQEKSISQIVAVFKVGKRHVALLLSMFTPNIYFGRDLGSFFLSKSDSDRIRNRFGQSLWQTMMEQTIQIGMSDEMVKIAWGLPEKINKSASVYGSEEQWVYYNQYVYFRNGICTGWN